MITYLRITIVWMCVIICSLRITKATTSVFQNCSSPQYGMIGQSHVIRCTIEIDSEGIYWFEQSNEREPVIRYEDETKIGRGYDNHEYDIENDGSLQINEVSTKHQMFYKVVVIDKAFIIYEREIRFVVHEERFEEIPFTDPFHQFGLVGKSAIIQLSIPSDFQGVYWYDERDTQDPFIRYEEETKLGRGYDDGEYDIFTNGSLKIEKVTISHDMVYSVVVIDSHYNTQEHNIRFTTVVYPEQRVPQITNCTTDSYCHVYVEDSDNVRCSVSGAKPAVNLEWFERITNNGSVLLARENIHAPNDQFSYLFDSSAILYGEMVPNIKPSVFVCRATGPAIKSNTFQQTVLVESTKLYDKMENLTINFENVINVANKKSVSLPCQTATEGSLVIWRKGSSVDKIKPILYTFYGNKVEDTDSEIAINKTGYLVLSNTHLHLEEVIVCVAVNDNETTFGQIFKLSVDDSADSTATTTQLPTEPSEKTIKFTTTKATEAEGKITPREMAGKTTKLTTQEFTTVTGTVQTLKITPTYIEPKQLAPLVVAIVVLAIVLASVASVGVGIWLFTKKRNGSMYDAVSTE